MPLSIEQYATAADGTPLHWTTYPTPNVPSPFCLVIHGGGFRTGGMKTGAQCAADLQAAGYFAVSIEYRVDTNKLAGQTSSGCWPQQTDDVKRCVRAARADKRCNGKVYVVGGSAGATHASSIAIEHETTIWWTPSDRVTAAVCLSGAYNFTNREPSQYLANQTEDFNLYCNTTDLSRQLAMSPISFVDGTAHPMFLVRSQNDPMPPGHQSDMIAKLKAVGVTSYQATTCSGAQHSFKNWPLVKSAAIAFLNSHK